MNMEREYELRKRLLATQAALRRLEGQQAELTAVKDELRSRDQQLQEMQREYGQTQLLTRVGRQLVLARQQPATVLRWPRRVAGLLKRRLQARSASVSAIALEVLEDSPLPVPGVGLGGEVLPLTCADDLPACLGDLRLGLISDRFTSESLSMECHTCDLRPLYWHEQLSEFRPHLVLVESAWKGVDGEWQGKVSEADEHLCALVMSCRSAGIPCVFWNKEDPLHFEAFLDTASLFDHVFTTDAAAVLRYRQRLGHERVTCLAFAVQPRLHHPFLEQDEVREEASFFAGAWYPHLQQRCHDFRELADALELAGPLVIHDRNGHDGGNNYPSAYADLVRDAVPYELTGTLYRSYRIGLTLNTIKHSPTMFARRAMELACTNTSVYSNYSQGLGMLMGDLVRMTDDGPTMLEWAWDELRQPHASIHRQRRLHALRKVVGEHTWQCRLEELVRNVLGIDLKPVQLPVAILANPDTQQELDRLLEMSRQQTVQAKLWLHPRAGMVLPAEVGRLDFAHLSMSPAELFAGQDVAFWHAEDGYGAHYLADLLAARRFDLGKVIGKGCYQDASAAADHWLHQEQEYRFVDFLAWRRSLAPADCWAAWSLSELFAAQQEGGFRAQRLLSIDRDSYVCGGDVSANLAIADRGLSQAQIDAGMGEMVASTPASVVPSLNAAQLFALWSRQPIPAGVSMQVKAGSLELVSRLPAGQVATMESGWLSAGALSGEDGRVSLRLQAEYGSQYTLLLEAADSAGNSLYRWPLFSYTAVTLPHDSRIHACRLLLQLRGQQVSYVSGISHGASADPLLMPGNERLLVIANGYPRRGDLYRNGFIHRRVKLYQQRGVAVDVVWLTDQQHRHSYEYDGITVQVCDAPTLEATLRHSRHVALALHFIDPVMWNAVKALAARIPTAIWIHGAEAQAWQRRCFLYDTDEARAHAQRISDERMRFWRDLLSSMPAQLQLVFVSQIQAGEVEQDLGMPLPTGRWRVIHNPIDTDLFCFREKSPEDRFRVLSIRPHASRVYANDLVARTIRQLARHEYFDRFQFTLVGDGKYWDEDFSGLEVFPNVTLLRGFIAQEEIKKLHDLHGVFLVPTRADTQGVSRDEAMASGLVPVTCDVGSVSEFVDSKCGFLCKAEDVSGLVQACLDMLYDHEKFLEMSVASGSRIRRTMSSDLIIDHELEVLGINVLA